jgi:hypothetical protein
MQREQQMSCMESAPGTVALAGHMPLCDTRTIAEQFKVPQAGFGFKDDTRATEACAPCT